MRLSKAQSIRSVDQSGGYGTLRHFLHGSFELITLRSLCEEFTGFFFVSDLSLSLFS
ncbi:uncharacterized protein MELLADRAFT_86998 [Melampsora larici-populina 98AG31]|uniref:Uncharacterized protein n=1 Tax=Melampsora larici-populina (strain 98AG31 / pathotype 3-4-7) TaxID=747676 RepID=F4R454_MELLP|nr:uncharacterized protein MELLADRAFT_86998 [Melampsora larici-populina 98AG31]EGG12742.1 hypothetical protein MELLADRAFT_86998 [Melampsora larici-populina 98AG31]